MRTRPCDGPGLGARNRKQLATELPDTSFEYPVKHVEGQYALHFSRADSSQARADTEPIPLVIRDGRIVMQSVYYALQPK